MKDKVNFFDIKSNISYRQYIISSFSDRIDDKFRIDFNNILNYVIDNNDVFNRTELEGSFYDGEDDTLDLILPAVARVFSKIYMKPPPIFVGCYDEGIRLELFQLRFDIDEFNEYLVEMLISSKGMLDKLGFLDRTAETISLIVDNYIAKLVNGVLDSYDIKSEIVKAKRDSKLKTIIK